MNPPVTAKPARWSPERSAMNHEGTSGWGGLPSPQTAAPVDLSERWIGLDVARGVALLGILMVNIHYFALPSGIFADTAPPDGSSAFSVVAWYAYRFFCETKFYPLFSLLFGVGLAIQFIRARERGQRWWGAPVRRLLALLCIGVAHALLVWFGDILFVYSIIGFAMVFLVRLRARGLAITACVLAVIVLLIAVLPALGTAFGSSSFPTAKVPIVLDDRPPVTQLLAGLGDRHLMGPWEAGYRELETRALRDGPFAQAMGVRAITWMIAAFFLILTGGAQILMLFCLGAAMLKAGWLKPDAARVQWRMVAVGLAVGLPAALVEILTGPHHTDWLAVFANTALASLGVPFLSMAYLGLALRWANSGSLAWLAHRVSLVGRMGLTNYLMCSLLGAFIFQHWGLARFGSLSTAQLLGVALGIYALVLVFSSLWLSTFRFGPMERLWRSATYGRWNVSA